MQLELPQSDETVSDIWVIKVITAFTATWPSWMEAWLHCYSNAGDTV